MDIVAAPPWEGIRSTGRQVSPKADIRSLAWARLLASFDRGSRRHREALDWIRVAPLVHRRDEDKILGMDRVVAFDLPQVQQGPPAVEEQAAVAVFV